MPDACNLQQPWASGRSAVIALLPNEYLIRPHGDSFAWCSNILIAPSVAIGLLAVPAPLCAHPEVAFACGRTCACACVACMCACACVRLPTTAITNLLPTRPGTAVYFILRSALENCVLRHTSVSRFRPTA
eukprot:scaffold201406_cov36-Tisochrysis_lutea.AAC.3